MNETKSEEIVIIIPVVNKLNRTGGIVKQKRPAIADRSLIFHLVTLS